MLEKDVQKPKEGVGSQGQPNPPVPEGQPQGEASEGEPVSVPKQDQAIDLAAEYIVNPTTGERMTGKQLLDGYKRGRGVDKLQSLVDTLNTESQKKDQLLAQYEADRAAIAQDNAIRAQLEKAGLVKTSGQSQEPDSWLNEGNEKPQLDPEAVTRSVTNAAEDVAKRYIGKLYGVDASQIDLDNVKPIPDQMREIQQEIEAGRERQEARNTFGQNLTTVYTRLLRDRYGLAITEDDAKQMVAKVASTMALNAEADKYAGSWDKESQEASMEYTKQGMDTLFSTVDQLADAKIEQEKKAREAELEKMVEGGQFPGLTQAETDDLAEGLNLNLPKDLKIYRKRVVEAEASKLDVIDAAKKSLGR